MSSESITTTRRAHLRSDGPAENPYGIRMNSWGVETEDQGLQNEESFAGSEDREGKTRLQDVMGPFEEGVYMGDILSTSSATVPDSR